MKSFLEIVIAFPILGMILLFLVAYPIPTVIGILWLLAFSRYLTGDQS